MDFVSTIYFDSESDEEEAEDSAKDKGKDKENTAESILNVDRSKDSKGEDMINFSISPKTIKEVTDYAVGRVVEGIVTALPAVVATGISKVSVPKILDGMPKASVPAKIGVVAATTFAAGFGTKAGIDTYNDIREKNAIEKIKKKFFEDTQGKSQDLSDSDTSPFSNPNLFPFTSKKSEEALTPESSVVTTALDQGDNSPISESAGSDISSPDTSFIMSPNEGTGILFDNPLSNLLHNLILLDFVHICYVCILLFLLCQKTVSLYLVKCIRYSLQKVNNKKVNTFLNYLLQKLEQAEGMNEKFYKVMFVVVLVLLLFTLLLNFFIVAYLHMDLDSFVSVYNYLKTKNS